MPRILLNKYLTCLSIRTSNIWSSNNGSLLITKPLLNSWYGLFLQAVFSPLVRVTMVPVLWWNLLAIFAVIWISYILQKILFNIWSISLVFVHFRKWNLTDSERNIMIYFSAGTEKTMISSRSINKRVKLSISQHFFRYRNRKL